MSETFTFCVINVTRFHTGGGMGVKVIDGMVFDHFDIFWNTIGQRLYHLPNLLLFTFSEYTNEVTKLGSG